jgi:hypothetical protein
MLLPLLMVLCRCVRRHVLLQCTALLAAELLMWMGTLSAGSHKLLLLLLAICCNSLQHAA